MAGLRVRERLGLNDERKREEWDDRIALLVGAVVLLVIAGAVVGSVAMFIRLYMSGPFPPNSNPFRVVFASRFMIGAVRLALIFLGVFLIVSILIHMRQGRWLTAAGPFKVLESVKRLTERVDEQAEDLAESRGETERLRTLVGELSTELRTTQVLLSKAQEQLKKQG